MILPARSLIVKQPDTYTSGSVCVCQNNLVSNSPRVFTRHLQGSRVSSLRHRGVSGFGMALGWLLVLVHADEDHKMPRFGAPG